MCNVPINSNCILIWWILFHLCERICSRASKGIKFNRSFFLCVKIHMKTAREAKYFTREVFHWSQSWQFSGIGRAHAWSPNGTWSRDVRGVKSADNFMNNWTYALSGSWRIGGVSVHPANGIFQLTVWAAWLINSLSWILNRLTGMSYAICLQQISLTLCTLRFNHTNSKQRLSYMKCIIYVIM